MKIEFQKGKVERVVERAAFHYYKGWYEGKGFFSWDPAVGFRLQATVDRQTNPLKGFGIGRSGVIRDDERRYVRLGLQGGGQGVIPRIPLVDRSDVLMGGYLDLRFSRLHLFRPKGGNLGSSAAIGEVILAGFGARPYLTDVVATRKRVGSARSLPSWSRDALEFADKAGLRVRGERSSEDPGQFRLGWSLGSRISKTGTIWSLPSALAYALTFVCGRRITPIESVTYSRSWQRQMVTLRPSPTDFGALALHDTEFMDGPLLAHLCKFFYRGGPEAEVARKLVDQVAEAARQQTWEASELLVATALEAALRTIHGEPFQPKEKRQWRADASMARFRAKYLTSEWRRTCNDVLAVWRRLRHRNAHPSWLVATERTAARAQSDLSDMGMLTRFYGAMILAMSGRPVSPHLNVPRL